MSENSSTSPPSYQVSSQTLVIDTSGQHAFLLEGMVTLPIGAVIGIPDGPDAEVVKVSLTRPFEDQPARLMLYVRTLKA